MKNKSYAKHLLSLLVTVLVAPTIVCLPLGLGQGHSPAFTVRKAYADTFPEDLEVEENEEAEDRSEEVDEFFLNGGTLTATYNEGYAPANAESTVYSDVPTFYMMQEFDEAGLPIEQLDPMFFEPDETTYYIQAPQSILKEKPDMDSMTVTSLYVTQQVTRIGVGDTWSKIRTEDGQEGFVLTNSISYEMVFEPIERTVWVEADKLTLRKEASVESEMLGTLYKDTKIRCIGVSAKWYHVIVADGGLEGTEGYVYLSYTTTQPPPTPTPTPIPVVNNSRSSGGGGGGSSSGGGGGGGGSSNRVDYSKVVDPSTVITGSNPESVVALAEAMIGTPYVWGAASASAVDCSGLVCYCYSEVANISLPHYSVSLCSVGVGVSREDVAPGDIVCWDNNGNGSCGHVGIYVGGGQCVEARGKQWGVVYCSIDRSPIITIRRIYN
ncbi:MAG: C40 family peptidase [Clostridiales bacterium]|nr:C40 family peptidase [Clostridiales bacterium]